MGVSVSGIRESVREEGEEALKEGELSIEWNDGEGRHVEKEGGPILSSLTAVERLIVSVVADKPTRIVGERHVSPAFSGMASFLPFLRQHLEVIVWL